MSFKHNFNICASHSTSLVNMFSFPLLVCSVMARARDSACGQCCGSCHSTSLKSSPLISTMAVLLIQQVWSRVNELTRAHPTGVLWPIINILEMLDFLISKIYLQNYIQIRIRGGFTAKKQNTWPLLSRRVQFHWENETYI